MSIVHISSVAQLDGIISQSGNKLTVIDFHATWCGPCHAIAPTFEALAKQYKNVIFLKCDVDAAQDVAQKYSVTAMPTFIFLKDGTKVHQIRGADKTSLEVNVRQFSDGSTSTSAFSGKGQTLGGSAPSAASLAAGVTNLDPQVKILLALIGAYVVFWCLS